MVKISGIITDVVNRKQYGGRLHIENGTIHKIEPADDVPERYILPGFTDAHIHIESSMLVPGEFAKLAVRHGTVATVSDPHEIANVCGTDGVDYMIENGRKVPLKFFFGAPSCVPATGFETAGAEISAKAVEKLLARPDILYLAEMMNWPGVLGCDPEVIAKIEAAQKAGKPVDGHAPGLQGEQAETYAKAGISTDHECFTIEEALDKLRFGIKIQIREGSAAKNYEALHPLFNSHPAELMFCSDDKHPDDLLLGHINELITRSLSHGYDLYDVLHVACVNPVRHYNLPVGLLQPGDPADFIITDNIHEMKVGETWIDGACVYRNGSVLFDAPKAGFINNFSSRTVFPEDFKLHSPRDEFAVIVARDGELITEKVTVRLPKTDQEVHCDPDRDILKISVVNRYQNAEPAVGFIKNFGLRNGAIASSVGHDCHNIIAVGDSDEAIATVVNLVMKHKGGIAAVHKGDEQVLPLPIAGIMTNEKGEETAAAYQKLNQMAADMGSRLKSPFMLISFMALLVIPSLKLSDKGLFDGETFRFVEL